MIYFPDYEIYSDVFVFIIFITCFSFLCFTVMIYTSTVFNYLGISIFLVFFIICLLDFNICKSNVDFVSSAVLAIYHHQISLPGSLDIKHPSLELKPEKTFV